MTFQILYNEKKILVLTVGCINYDHDINHYEPIKSLFNNVSRYDYYTRFKEIGRDGMNRELLDVVREEAPDYIFYITYQNQIKRDTLTKIRATGVKIIGWFSDDQWRFDNYSKDLARYLDYQITTDSAAYKKYLDLGFVPIHCQWGSNEHHYRQIKGLPKTYDVSFVGAKHGLRKSYFEQLQAGGIKVTGFGRDWNGRITFDEMIRVFNQSKINLNFSASSVDSTIRQIKGRHFEIPMCGGFLLTDYVEGLEDYFLLGVEVETFTNINEAIDKINYYLAHDEEREQIAKAGYRKSISFHTWENRFKKVFDTVFQCDSKQQTPPSPGIMQQMMDRLLKY